MRRLVTTAATVLALALPGAPALAAGDPLRDQQWGLHMVEAPAAWPTSTGVGAVVAVIDSGVQADHPDLAGRLLSGWDYVDKDGDPDDGEGHGTHVTGVVVAVRDNGEGITGVAPGARVLPLRVLDDDGGGWTDDIVKAVDEAIKRGAHVINLSLGDAIPLQSALFGDPAFEEALERAVDRNIVVALAAGNSSLPLCENPRLEGTLCIGSVDRRGSRSVFSSFGGEVDVMAPGGSGLGGADEDVLSTYLRSGYASVAGTSQATPHVAGVAALLASLGVRGRTAARRIVSTAAAHADSGQRIVNARAAVAGLAPPPPAGGPGAGDGTAERGRFSAPRRIGVRKLRKRGLRVACRPVRPGRCVVRVVHRRKRIVAGREDVPARQRTVVVAELTKKGRRRVARMKRKRIRAQLRVKLPGEPARRQRLVIRRR